MSKRDQVNGLGVKNPAKMFIEFQGGAKGGNFEFYDKIAKEKVNIPYQSLKFLIVTELTTITGYNRAKGGLFSNEVEDQNNEELIVRYYKGDNKLIAKGLYKDIKDVITSRSVGGKFTKSIYIALYYKKEWSLQNLKLSGKQLTSWIALHEELRNNGVKISESMIYVKNVEFVDGEISFHYPEFGYTVLKPNDANQKSVILKADDYYDVIKDFIKKRKEGVTEGFSPREAQAPVKDINTKEKSTAFVDDDLEDEGMPF